MSALLTLSATSPAILSDRLVGPNKRFRIQKFRTRFGEIEYFGFDAADVTDAQVRAGKLIEPFAQGAYAAVRAAIQRRRRARP